MYFSRNSSRYHTLVLLSPSSALSVKNAFFLLWQLVILICHHPNIGRVSRTGVPNRWSNYKCLINYPIMAYFKTQFYVLHDPTNSFWICMYQNLSFITGLKELHIFMLIFFVSFVDYYFFEFMCQWKTLILFSNIIYTPQRSPLSIPSPIKIIQFANIRWNGAGICLPL